MKSLLVPKNKKLNKATQPFDKKTSARFRVNQ